jgi:hypothetical protein
VILVAAEDVDAFPFVTRAEAVAAADRWAGGMRADDVGSRLLSSAERIVTHPDLERPLEGRIATNLFVIQSLLFESSLAFRLTGEERFVLPVRRVLRSLTDDDRRRSQLPDEVHLGFVMSGVGVAAGLCGDAVDPGLVRQVATAVGHDLTASARYAPWGKRLPRRAAWNHTAVGYAGLGCAGLLCRDEDQGQVWIEQALERLSGFFDVGISDAGMTREGLHYAGFVFRNAAGFLLACRNLGIFDYRDPAANPHLEHLRKVPSWFAAEVLPAGSWLRNENDSDWDPRRAMGGFLPLFGPLDPTTVAWVHWRLLGPGGSGNHGQDLALVASALFETVLWPPEPPGRAPVAPDVLADPDIGYLAERVHTGRSSGFSLSCGRRQRGLHGQSDAGSVTFDAYDLPILIDSGSANDPTEGSRSSSRAHNLVLIDGRGQLPSGRGQVVSGTIVQACRGAVATSVTCDLAQAYDADHYNHVRHAVRHCLYVRAPIPYLLVVDDIARPRRLPSTFEQVFQTPPATDVHLEPGKARLRVKFDGDTTWMSLNALDPCTIDHEPTTTRAIPCPQHDTWVLRRQGHGGPMATLILPEPLGASIHFRASMDPRAGKITLRFTHADSHWTDRLDFTPGQPNPARFTRDDACPDEHLLLRARPQRQPDSLVPKLPSVRRFLLHRARHHAGPGGS